MDNYLNCSSEFVYLNFSRYEMKTLPSWKLEICLNYSVRGFIYSTSSRVTYFTILQNWRTHISRHLIFYNWNDIFTIFSAVLTSKLLVRTWLKNEKKVEEVGGEAGKGDEKKINSHTIKIPKVSKPRLSSDLRYRDSLLKYGEPSRPTMWHSKIYNL